jgi:hypothetical protein
MSNHDSFCEIQQGRMSCSCYRRRRSSDIDSDLEITFPPYEEELKAFGVFWCGPENYERGKESLVARILPAIRDAPVVEISCLPLPLRTYVVRVLETAERKAYELYTGSGQAKLAFDIGLAICKREIGLASADKEKAPVPEPSIRELAFALYCNNHGHLTLEEFGQAGCIENYEEIARKKPEDARAIFDRQSQFKSGK